VHWVKTGHRQTLHTNPPKQNPSKQSLLPPKRANQPQLKPGKEVEAAFFESRRYAAIKGATAGFEKAEGLAFSARYKQVYFITASINNGMTTDPKFNHAGEFVGYRIIPVGWASCLLHHARSGTVPSASPNTPTAQQCNSTTPKAPTTSICQRTRVAACLRWTWTRTGRPPEPSCC